MAEKDNKLKTAAKPAVKPTTPTAKPAASTAKTTLQRTARPAPAAPTSRSNTVASSSTPAPAKPANAVKPTAKSAAANAKTTASPEKRAVSNTKSAQTTVRPAPVATRPAAKAVASTQPKTSATAANKEVKPAVAATIKPNSGVKQQTEKSVKVAAITKQESKKRNQTINKQKPQKNVARKSSNAETAIDSKQRMRIIIMSAVACVLALILVISLIAGVNSCGADKGPMFSSNNPPSVLPTQIVGNDKPVSPSQNVLSPVDPSNPELKDSFKNEFTGTSLVGYSGKVTGTVERVKPIDELKNEGLPDYPKYGYTLSNVLGSGEDKVAARQALIAESSYLTATGTRNAGGGGYTWMDKDGYLYSGTTADPVPALDSDTNEHRQLYKHSASVGLYLGDVADDEPGIVKKVTMRPRGYYGYSVTGIYAPAGEVIKIQMTEADMIATGGIKIHIGQALYNDKANNIWAKKNQMQRIPHLLNTMSVNTSTATLQNGIYTAYIGSFIGGPIYICNENVTFSATISGGVKYSHFILGYTTKEEFEENATSSAPYFDMEVWNFGMLHSGPKYYARGFTYEDIYKAAVLWEKVSTVTTTGSSQGIVFLYDPFVAAGAAVAFPGQRAVNCPAGWMRDSLNYNGLVSSGSWGNFHEYHHNFQGYGVGNGGEVTNNAMTLVSYALFTKISSKRGISSFGAQGLGGWNNYTSATWALEETLKIARKNESPSNGNQGLALYATLLHNFGANNFIQAKINQRGGQLYQTYFTAWQNVTHNNMSYYFKDVLGGVTASVANELANKNYPMFVPVSCVYQTGRSYMYDGQKQYFKTMQPYVIPYGVPFNIDLSRYNSPNGQYSSGSIVIPEGFDYRIKSVTSPEHGSVKVTDKYNVLFTPDENLHSGQILVTLEIVKKDGAFKVDDVDLILEFEQSHETNKMTLERTTYSYTSDNMFTDAQEAYENNYGTYENSITADHSNPTQNCNTDIWFYPDTQANRDKYPNSPDSHFVKDNTITELRGKLYFEDEGTYRIFLRGRLNCAFYYSTDGGKTYVQGATIKDTSVPANSHLFRPGNAETYVDIEIETQTWIYFKTVLIVQSSPMVSYVGLGMTKWTVPMFTIQEIKDADGNVIETKYFDYQGNEVTEEEANNASPIAPSTTAQPSYVNAYRTDYEFPSNNDFETEYFYVRAHTYTYSTEYSVTTKDFPDISSLSNNCLPDNPIQNLFDDNPNNYCSSLDVVSETAPMEMTIDLGKTITANRFVLTGFLYNNSANKNQTPNSITLYLGDSPDNLTEITSFDNGTVTGITLQFNFETTTFRYYKLVVRKTVEGRYASITSIKFLNNISNGTQIAPSNSSLIFKGNWSSVQTQSTFGYAYLGHTNDTVKFEFTGTRLGLLSSSEFGKQFEVYIDGKKADSIDLKKDNGAFAVSYMSALLENGKHSVIIKCIGEASIDSVVVYQ